jgi:hypothetical protein
VRAIISGLLSSYVQIYDGINMNKGIFIKVVLWHKKGHLMTRKNIYRFARTPSIE